MINEAKANNTNENYSRYFPYFNYKLYENPSDSQEELEDSYEFYTNNLSLEDDTSSTISHEYFHKMEDEEEEKYIPLNLLDFSPRKSNLKLDKISDISTKPLFDFKDEEVKNQSDSSEIKPELLKYKLPKSLFKISTPRQIEAKINSQNFISNPDVPKFESAKSIIKVNIFNKHIPIPFVCNTNNNNNKKRANNKNKNVKTKRKKEFIEKEGDWPCYFCKNINFFFRKKCNKCHLLKEESEKKYKEKVDILLKLVDKSMHEKRNAK